jgi:DNA-binding CsgD family transcriptional regulator
MKQVAHRRSTVKGTVATFEGLKSLPTSAVILDASGTIVAANDAWREFGRRNGLRIAQSAIGSNYLQYCRSKDPQLRRFVRELKALLAGQLDLLTFIYPCDSPTRKRWFSLIGVPLSLDRPAGIALLHVNLTDMLPLLTSTRGMRAKGRRREHARLATDLEAISGAVERSVSETLSSQLDAMFTEPRQIAAREKGDQKFLVRSRLSKRQMEVLRLLGEGKTNKEMARELFLSPNTVKLHVSAILQRLKLRSRTQAALLSSQLHKQDWGDLVEGGLNSSKKMRTAA